MFITLQHSAGVSRAPHKHCLSAPSHASALPTVQLGSGCTRNARARRRKQARPRRSSPVVAHALRQHAQQLPAGAQRNGPHL